MYNGTVKWCSITPSLCILLAATLPGDFPTHFQKKKKPPQRTHLFSSDNPQWCTTEEHNCEISSTFSPPSSKFWVVHSIDVQPPTKRRGSRQRLLCAPSLRPSTCTMKVFIVERRYPTRPALRSIHTSESTSSLWGCISLCWLSFPETV